MKLRMDHILEEIRQNQEAVLEIEAEGKKYVRNFKRMERLIICGCGNVGQEISRYAAYLGFYVIAADDRPEFANNACMPDAREIYCDDFSRILKRIQVNDADYVTVVTRGHRFDMDCLRSILSGEVPRYLGMMASKRRACGVRELLLEEGFDEETLAQIHTPIGLSIGAVTPREIGLSIAAELIACRRENRQKLHGSTELSCEDIDENFVDFLEKDKSEKALLLVCETSGSTPVKSGAVMALNRGMKTAGTIGGGCAEGIALREAFRLIGTGKNKMLELNMNNDVAAEAGMACGGRMKVWITDLEA